MCSACLKALRTPTSVMGFSDDNLFVTPNGVNLNAFRTTSDPEFPDRSIYLAKIDYRKRQHMFQSIDSLWYAGNNADNRFDTEKNYLGEWSKDVLHDHLTEYGNLVLLSDGEAHPLVCMEALAAGLGVVVTEWGKLIWMKQGSSSRSFQRVKFLILNMWNKRSFRIESIPCKIEKK